MASYRNLDGHTFELGRLDAAERRLVTKIIERGDERPEYSVFRNWWMQAVDKFYSARGLTRRQILKSVGYRIGSDICGRIGIAEGWMLGPDYRDELEQLISQRFRSRREFCKAAGISEDMLSHVLKKRKHLAIDTLAEALERIGYALHIVPRDEAVKQVG